MDNDILEGLIRRSMAPASAVPIDIADQYDPNPGARPGSLLDMMTRQKKPLPPGWVDPTQVSTAFPQQQPWTPTEPHYGNTFSAYYGPETPANFVPPAQQQPPMPFQNSGMLPDTPKPAPPLPPPTEIENKPIREASGEPTGGDQRPAVSEQTRQMVMQQQPPVADMGQQAGILGGFGDWLREHSNQLLAMGAGLAGAPSLHAGIGRAAAYSIPAIQQDIAMQQQRGGVQASYNALLSSLQKSGMDPEQAHNLAVAGATNPKLFDSLMTQFASPTKYEKAEIKSSGLFGETTRTMMYDPRNPQDRFFLDEGPGGGGGGGGGGRGGGGGPGGSGGGAAPAGPTLPNAPAGSNIQQTGGGQPQQQLQDQNVPPSAGGNGMGFFAPGYTEQNIDQNKTGDDFLAQFSPIVQNDMKKYLAGTFDSSGRQKYGTAIRSLAGLYGAGIGVDADPNAIFQRRQYARELGGTTSGVGLKTYSLGQGLDHFVDIADSIQDMHLSGGLGWKRLAHAWNKAKSESSTMEGLQNHVGVLGQGLAGETGKLMSGRSGGGVHEREDMKNYLANVYQSRQGAAGSMEGMLDLLEGGINELEADRNKRFGEDPRNWPKNADFMDAHRQAQVQHIRDVIAGLKTGRTVPPMSPNYAGGGGGAGAAAPVQFKPGQRYTVDAQGNVVNQ